MKNRNKNGISLIVLVITIIVIIILAAAVILTINNNNPMDNANKARYMSDRANVQDALSTAIGKIAAEKLGSVTVPAQTNIASGIGYYLTGANDGIIGGKIGWDSLSTVSDGYEATTMLGMKLPDYGSNTRWFINNNGEVSVEVAGIIYGTVETLNGGTRNKAEAAWNQPYVPAGFSYVEGTVDTGYIIQDSSDNQYVWVPVDGINVAYVKKLDYPNNTGNVGIDIDNRKPELTCGGFYIARYEAGKSVDGKTIDETNVVMKKGASVWNNINFDQAKAKAKDVKNIYHYADGTTNLLTGIQWDTVIKWLETKGIQIDNTISWGNHSDNPDRISVTPNNPANSGVHENWKAQNIYDLAGNVWEWTDEASHSGYIFRGGGCDYSGSEIPVSVRNHNIGTYTGVFLGFRVALYFE